MSILLTGGAGDLGRVLAKHLGPQAIRLDVRPPMDAYGTFLPGSILDRPFLNRVVGGMQSVVHIAAWHGYHEAIGSKDVYDFWELNVTGTFNVFEACARAGVPNVIFISSTSVLDGDSIYGHTKILGEEIARTYAARHGMKVITLRPRAFIPPWNKAVYKTFSEWAQWFWGGAVHIDDVAQSVLLSLDVMPRSVFTTMPILTLDSAYEYTDADLQQWRGLETFRRYYAHYEALAVQYGLDPSLKPQKLDITETQNVLGYVPKYSLQTLFEELTQYGEAGPPAP